MKGGDFQSPQFHGTSTDVGDHAIAWAPLHQRSCTRTLEAVTAIQFNEAGSVRQQPRRVLRSPKLCLRLSYPVEPLEVRGPPASLPDKAENGDFLWGGKERLEPARDLPALCAGLPGLP
jgi:hypothetical protein